MAKQDTKKKVTAAQVAAILAAIQKDYVQAPRNISVYDNQNPDNIKRWEEQNKNSKRNRAAHRAATRRDQRVERKRERELGKLTPTSRVSTGPSVGRQGRTFEELDEKTRKAILETDKTNAETEALGGKVKHDKSVFNRVLDVLSRGNYGAAEGIKDAAEDYAQRRYVAKGKKAAKSDFDVSDFLGAMSKVPAGFVQGFTGKEKTSFSDVLQSNADNRKAVKEGRSPAASVEGEGKVNRLHKYGAGFVADVALDPTTYLGLGLVSKAATGGRVLSSGKAAKGLEKTAQTVAKITSSNKNIAPEAVREALGVSRAPVERITRRHAKQLSPEARQLFDAIKAERKGTGFVRKGSAETALVGRKIRGSGSRAWVDLKDLPGDKGRAIAQARIDKELAEFPGFHKSLRKARGISRTKLVDSFYSTFGYADRAGALRLVDNMTNKGMQDKVFADQIADPKYSSVNAKTREEFADYVTAHEMGHHAGFIIPKADRDEFAQHLSKKYKGQDQSDLLSSYSKVVNNAGENEEFWAEAWAEYRLKGKNARPLAKEAGEFMEKYLKDAPADRIQHDLLRNIADETAKSVREDITEEVLGKHGLNPWRYEDFKTNPAAFADVKKEIDELVKARGFGNKGKKAFEAELVKTMYRNLSPEIAKQFKIKLGPAAIAVPGVAKGVTMAAEKVGSYKHVKTSTDWFNDNFRANAHIPESISYLRNKANALGFNVVREYTRELQRVFDPVPASVRRDVWKAVQNGYVDGTVVKGGVSAFDNTPVENVAKYTQDQIESINRSVMEVGISNSELNAWLPEKFQITGAKFADFVKDKKTGNLVKDMDPERIQKAILANPNIDDPAKALHYYHAAVNQAIAKRSMWETSAQTFGVPGASKGGTMIKTLKQQGWRTVNINNPAIKDVLFEPEIAEGLERFNKVFSDSRTRDGFLDTFDRGTQTLKGILTKYNPSFHTRTFLGEILLGYIGGMRNMPRSYTIAGKVLKGSNQEFFGATGMAGQDASRGVIQTANVLTGRGRSAELADAQAALGGKVVMRTKFGPLTADQVRHYYMQSGLKQGYAATDLLKGVDAQVGRKIGGMLNRGTTQATEAVEDFGRMAHFIDILHHTKARTLEDALQEAAETVSKYHLDYTAVTQWEKTWATRFVPFYKWLRLSAPVITEALLAQPGKALVLPKTMQALSGMAGYDTNEFGAFPGGPDEVVPEWLRDQGALPVGESFGNTQYFSPQSIFPLSSVVETASENPLDVINPLIKAPFEFLANYKKFQPNGPRSNPEELLKFLSSQTPQTSMAYQMAPGSVAKKRDPGIDRRQTALAFLSNPGIQPNTEKRMGAEAQRLKKEATDNRVKQFGKKKEREELIKRLKQEGLLK